MRVHVEYMRVHESTCKRLIFLTSKFTKEYPELTQSELLGISMVDDNGS